MGKVLAFARERPASGSPAAVHLDLRAIGGDVAFAIRAFLARAGYYDRLFVEIHDSGEMIVLDSREGPAGTIFVPGWMLELEGSRILDLCMQCGLQGGGIVGMTVVSGRAGMVRSNQGFVAQARRGLLQ